MDGTIKYKKASNHLIISCFLMIVFMMSSKYAYTAQMVELLDVFKISPEKFTLAPTIYFIIYATVQLILATFISKLNMKRFMLISVGISCILTVIMAFSTGLIYFCIIMAILGIAQAGTWAGCMYFLTKHLPVSMLQKANTMMTIAFPIGSVLTYCVASVCVALDKWWLCFVVIGLLFLVVLAYFILSVTAIEKLPKHLAFELDEQIKEKKQGFSTVTISKTRLKINLNVKTVKFLYYLLVGVTCFMTYNVYSSIIDFVPKMLSDTHGLDNSLAIIFSVVVPIGVAFGPILIINLCERFSNYYLVALIGGAMLVVVMVAVLFGYSTNVVVALTTVLGAALLSRAVCSIFETVIVARMKEQINAGSFSAYTNATASFGAAAAPMIMGICISKSWTTTYTVLLIESVVIVAFTACFMLFLRKSKPQG